MKRLFFLLLIPLLAGKSVPVNPAYMGKYQFIDQDKKQATIWIVSQNPKSPDKIDFRRTTDREPLFTAEMEDATHFKTKHEFTEHVSTGIDVRRTCAGTFADGAMTLLIQYVSTTYGVSKNLSHKSESEHIYKKVSEKASQPVQATDSSTK